MTPSKDTLEAANPASEAAVSEANSRAKQDASRMRSDAVSLEVPVKVHGSRVKDVVLGTTPHTEAFEEQASTMIVFPQGSVLRMTTPVAAGQMMVVTNLKSGHDAICRVVKVRAFGQGQSYVEIEFTHRQPGYWGVHFPSDAADTPSPAAPVASAAPAAPPVSVEVKVEKTEEKSAADVSWAPASSLKPTAAKPAGQTRKQDSAFAQIGSQEDVQPAASSTSSRARTSSARDTDSKGVAAEAARKSLLADLPSTALASPASSLSMAELQGDAQAAPAVSFAGAGVPGEVADAPPADTGRSAEQSRAPFGRFAASASLGGGHAAREPFGGLSGGSLGISGHPSESGQSKGRNWLAIAASVVVLLAAGTGAAYYLHMPPFAAKSARPTAVVAAPAAPPVEATPQPTAVSEPASATAGPATQPTAASAPVAKSAPPVTAQAAQPATTTTKSNKPAPSAPIAASTLAEQKPTAKVPDMFGTINAHPTSRSHSADSGQADAAPALDAAAGNEGGELPAFGASAAVAPPAPVAPEGPVRIKVGGALKPPRLLSSVLPVYPAIARDTGIEGDIVVDTTIDAAGKVTAMKVISGPPVLRQSALDALRQWKYAPSMLNGQPVPVQMTVTLKFHRQ
jgi:periplasmic protein TonB